MIIVRITMRAEKMFIIFVGFGKDMGRIIKQAEIKIMMNSMEIDWMIKLDERSNIVVAEAGKPMNTCWFFNG